MLLPFRLYNHRSHNSTVVGEICKAAGRLVLLSGLIAFSSLSLASASEKVQASVKSGKAINSLFLDISRADSDKRLVSVGERGHIFYSDDNGLSWTQADVPTIQLLTAVSFPSKSIGYAVGHDAIILKTTDAGVSWQKIYEDKPAEIPLLDVWFENEERGIAVGAYGYIVLTEDGGKTWGSISNRIENEDEFHYNAINDDGRGNLYMVGEAGIMYRSFDVGRSWETMNSPYEGSWFGVNASGYGDVLVHGLRGNIYKSSDKGTTWKALSSGTDQTLFGSVRTKDGKNIVVGNSGAFVTGKPASWQATNRSDRMALSALETASDGNLVVAGQGGLYRMSPEGKELNNK